MAERVAPVIPAPELTEREWYELHGCSHGHCPCGCEHPQPFVTGRRLVCGRCACVDGYLCDMLPCTPEVCGDG